MIEAWGPPTGKHVDAEEPFTVFVGAGLHATVAVQPTDHFRADYLVLEEPEKWEVLEIAVGSMSQFHHRTKETVRPARWFNDAYALGVPLRFDTCARGNIIVLVVLNLLKEETSLSGKWIGKKLVSL